MNGTNADDLRDPSRLGLIAASTWRVASPLATLTKRSVRALARVADLPNWDWAAAPCLRSRLAVGVPATPETLSRIEVAEDAVREVLELGPEVAFRVRRLPGGVGIVALEGGVLRGKRGEEEGRRQLDEVARRVGGFGFEEVRFEAFRSGELAGVADVLEAETS